METRTLIVDDEKSICSILAMRLSEEGFVCVTANNGREALSHFDKDTYSIIISDMKMPEIAGLELLKRVRALDPRAIVIILTACPEIDLAVEAMRAGAYDFLMKPVDFESFVKAVSELGLYWLLLNQPPR